ncbi:hypothetical protein K402DRAFT_393873 [Aulographum hederae CBS 113979]|uniref:UBX domain-containing protein n=1 Tax=Aulographum hederae CBS 113979 TaxID=1176131 RepID=A0A6G1GZN9_9PEZI|nr:hypothetical protein K402DRAFT_393873 [Aulographum hederae CBS 113979]
MATDAVDLGELTADQQLALQQFTSITDQAVEQAIPLLRRCQWNAQIAIARFFDGEPPNPIPESIPDIPPPRDNRRQETLLNNIPLAGSSRRTNFEPAPRVVNPPNSQGPYQPGAILSLLFTPINLLYGILTRSFSFLGWLFPFLPRLISPLTGPSSNRRNIGGRRPLNGRDAAARFHREFEEEYGTHTLPFQETGYAQAFDTAKRDLKFLLVILLSPEHDDTSSFVKDTLLAPEVVDYLNSNKNNILVWIGNVQDSEAYQVSTALHCTKLPFTGLIVHTPSASSTAMSVVARIAGPTSAASLLQSVQRAIQQNSEALGRVRTTRAEQAATRTLREQQESAYERSLAQDRERARQKKEAEEARKREEDAAKAAADAEERHATNLARWKRLRASKIAPEPGSDVKDAVRISLRLGDGERIVRKFAPNAPMEELYAFVECYDVLQEEIDEKVDEPESDFEHKYDFRLVSPMPREAYKLEAGGTVREKIGRSGNLIVERIDADDDEDEDA